MTQMLRKTVPHIVLGLCMLAGISGTKATASAKDPVVCRVEIDRNVFLAGEPQKAVLKISLDALMPAEQTDRLPVNLAVVLDRSGSMSGEKLEKAKDAAIEALRRLSPEDTFSLVMYDHNVETVVPAQSARNTEWIESRIRQIQPGGNTALFNGVNQGAAEIRKNVSRQAVHRILLLSDGLANVGPSQPEDLGRLGAALIKEGISVSTVGVGTDYNEDLMARLSQEGDGNTFFAENSADLPRIFKAELGDVLSVVAKKVKVKIECPEGVKPLGIIGRVGRIIGRTVEFSLNQLYGGQEKYALIEVEIPACKHGDAREIATAQVIYENPFTQKETIATGQATVRFSEDKSEVEGSANVTVQRDYQITFNAVVKDKAIALADDGKEEEAKKVLEESAKQMKEQGLKNQDEKLLKEAQAAQSDLDAVNEKGWDKRNRKKMRSDSYQTTNQQMAQ